MSAYSWQGLRLEASLLQSHPVPWSLGHGLRKRMGEVHSPTSQWLHLFFTSTLVDTCLHFVNMETSTQNSSVLPRVSWQVWKATAPSWSAPKSLQTLPKTQHDQNARLRREPTGKTPALLSGCAASGRSWAVQRCPPRVAPAYVTAATLHISQGAGASRTRRAAWRAVFTACGWLHFCCVWWGVGGWAARRLGSAQTYHPLPQAFWVDRGWTRGTTDLGLSVHWFAQPQGHTAWPPIAVSGVWSACVVQRLN